MTADQIRNQENTCDDGAWQCAEWLKEIAAQLADQNEQIHEDRELRRAIAEEERTARIKRDEMLSGYGGTLGKVADVIGAPPVIPPRLVFPQEVVHLGCLLREPDGTYIIASEIGRTQLEPEEAQRILALISPSQSEAKPQ